MQINLRKLWPAIGLMCMGLFSTASAHAYSNNSQSDSMSQGSQDTSGQGTYHRGNYREITPNAGPRVAHGADVFITADFIWWKAVQEGTDYATTGVAGFDYQSQQNQLLNVSRGHERSVGRDWAPGFKVGLGLNLSHDGWDIYAEYTWLRPSNSSSLSADNVLSKTVVVQDGPNARANRATANWDLDFNVIDVELGRNFYLSQFLTMRPFIGLKATWQNQDTRIKFFNPDGYEAGEDGQGNNIKVEGPYKIHEQMDNWGIGVRGGFDISWYMSKQWSIYGDLAWTTMWVDYTDITRKDTIDDPTQATGSSSVTPQNIKIDDHYSVKNILELELGLRWEILFYDDNYHFAIQAGWEQQVWSNWGTSFDFLNGQTWNDLNFHGLNLKLRFDF